MTETLTRDGDKAMERVRDVAENALGRGRRTWKALTGQGQDVIDQAEKNVLEAREDAEKLIRKHPGKAVGLALLVGVAMGAAIVGIRKT